MAKLTLDLNKIIMDKNINPRKIKIESNINCYDCEAKGCRKITTRNSVHEH